MATRLHMNPSIYFVLGVLSQVIFIEEFSLLVSQIIIYCFLTGILMLSIYYIYSRIISMNRDNYKRFALIITAMIITFLFSFTMFYIFYIRNFDVSANANNILGEYAAVASTVSFTPLVGLISSWLVDKWWWRRHKKVLAN